MAIAIASTEEDEECSNPGTQSHSYSHSDGECSVGFSCMKNGLEDSLMKNAVTLEGKAVATVEEGHSLSSNLQEKGIQVKMENVLTQEEKAIAIASQEVVYKAITLEKTIAIDSQVTVSKSVEGNDLTTKKKMQTRTPEDMGQNTVTLEEEVQNTVTIENTVVAPDGEETLPLEEMVKQLQAEILALRRKRADEGRANEKVVSIFASREQAWKAEKKRFMNEQRRLWQELQRAFMEQEFLRQRTQHLGTVQEEGDLEFACEECEQRDGLLVEMKERLHEQEFIIMASMEEAKAEQQEKNALIGKLAVVEADLCEAKEKFSVEAEARTHDLHTHEAALTELETTCRTLEMEKLLALQDLKSSLNNLADITQEKKHYEDLVAQMSSEIHMLQTAAQEKEDIISAMLKKADADAEERHELERELAIIKAKFLHAESEKEKLQKHMDSNNHSCTAKDMLKPRRSFGSRIESGYDRMRELQRLHDAEIRDLQSAFEEEVKLLQKRLNLFQERVADLEEDMLLRMAKNTKHMNSLKENHTRSHAEFINGGGLMVFDDFMESDTATKQFQLSVAKTLLSQYMDSDAHREQEIEKWKKAYFASKTTIEILQKERGHTVSSPKNPALQDWLELEKCRSKMEQRHMQEIDAFERQLKARDERMEAFRQQLLTMEEESQRRLAEVEALKKGLGRAIEEKLRLQELLKANGGELGQREAVH